MQGLVLIAGGCLEFVAWGVDAQTGEEGYLRSDVTADAGAYLMDAVRIERDLHLRDIFALLESAIPSCFRCLSGSTPPSI